MHTARRLFFASMLHSFSKGSVLLLVLLAFFGAQWSYAGSAPPGAKVGFALDFPNSIPDHYMISVAADGQATYDSTGKLTPEGETPEPFHLDFQVTPATTAKIFELSAKAKYFEGKVDSGKKNLAWTGQKTLTYKDGERNTRAEYNYSPSVSVQQVTSIFQNLSTTLEFGRRLHYYHHYQKLALDDELKRMEEMNRGGSLVEVQAVAPILREITNDTTVMNVARARAQRLLAATATASGH